MNSENSRSQMPSLENEHGRPNENSNNEALPTPTDPAFDVMDPDKTLFRKQNPPFLYADNVGSLTASPFSGPGEHGRNTHAIPHDLSQGPPSSVRSWRTELVRHTRAFWSKNRSVFLVALAQLFGALMNLVARLLEVEGEGMHPFQILFFRQGLTTIFASIYMYRTRVPNFPLGSKDVRLLLVARGLCGFFGIYGMWYSMMFLPLAEATVITFLAPGLAGYICHLLLKDPFTRKEQVGSLIALGGVILIARPTPLSDHATPSIQDTTATLEGDSTAPLEIPANLTQTLSQLGGEPTPGQRLGAISMALLGVLGASGAFTTIRWIGKRAHPLISVNYFAIWCTIVSTTVLSVAPILHIGQPAVQFAIPTSIRQWFLLLCLGGTGFVMQFMLTSGLGSERSNKATAMVYTHMLFAAGFDRWVFGHHMGLVSLIGCGLILGSAVWVALTKTETAYGEQKDDMELGVVPGAEGIPMLRDNVLIEDEEGEGEEEDRQVHK